MSTCVVLLRVLSLHRSLDCGAVAVPSQVQQHGELQRSHLELVRRRHHSPQVVASSHSSTASRRRHRRDDMADFHKDLPGGEEPLPAPEVRRRRRRNISTDSGPVYHGVRSTTIWCIVMSTMLVGMLFVLYGLLLLFEFALAGMGSASTDGSDVGELEQGASQATAKEVPKTGSRIYVLDTAKFLALPLVCVWHMGCSSGYCHFIAFHTRIFCFVSGVVSKDPPSMKQFRSVTFNLVVPTMMYCFVLTPFVFPLLHWRLPTEEDYGYVNVFRYYFKANARVVWFLIALTFWRIWGFMLMPLKRSARLPVAVCFAAISGYVDLGDTYNPEDGAFKLGNAAVFFPVFVAGQLFPLEVVFENIPWRWTYFLLGVALIGALFYTEGSATGRAFMSGVPTQGGWAGKDFISVQESGLFWAREILFFNTLSIVKTLIFIVLCCPRVSSFMSDLGQHSLYPYLLHLQFIEPIARLLSLAGIELTSSSLIELAVSIPLCTLLATNPVRKVFGVFIQPMWLEYLLGDASAQKQSTPAPTVTQSVPTMHLKPPTSGSPSSSRASSKSRIMEYLQPRRKSGQGSQES